YAGLEAFAVGQADAVSFEFEDGEAGNPVGGAGLQAVEAHSPLPDLGPLGHTDTKLVALPFRRDRDGKGAKLLPRIMMHHHVTRDSVFLVGFDPERDVVELARLKVELNVVHLRPPGDRAFLV